MISIRGLAAVDLIGFGPRFVIIEFAIGVAGPLPKTSHLKEFEIPS